MFKPLSASALFAGLAALSIPAQENYAQWFHGRDVIVNTKASGAGVLGPVGRFPLLVRLGAGDSAVFRTAGPGGRSLRFSRAGGAVRLAHEIESWDATARAAAIWVRLDTLPGNDSAARFTMHWGRPGAADSSSARAVFDTAAGFHGVWHMKGASATANEPDATPNALTAVAGGTPSAVAGAVGGARRFFGAEHFEVVNSAAKLNLPVDGAFMLSAWVRSPTPVGNSTVLSKADLGYNLKLNVNGDWEIVNYATGTGWQAAGGFGETADWTLVAGTWQGIDGALYLNASRIDAGVLSTSGTGIRVENTDLQIGRQNSPSARRHFAGEIDEVRVERARDAHWIKLSYETQKPAARTVTFGATQNAAPSPLSNFFYRNVPVEDTLVWKADSLFTLEPTYQGGPADSFTVTGTLPPGLALDKRTGALSRTSATLSAAGTFAVKAHGSSSAADTVARKVRVLAGPVGLFARSLPAQGLSLAFGSGRLALLGFRGLASGRASTAILTLSDLSGRPVWVRALSLEGAEHSWSLPRLPTGVYMARVALRDASGRPLGTVESKVPLTR